MARFIHHVPEVCQAPRLADDVKQVAMFGAGGISPFTSRAFSLCAALKPDKHGATRGVTRVANQPVMTLPASRRQIMLTDCFGLPGKTAGKVGRIVLVHHAS